MTIEQANKILKDAFYDENTPPDYLLAVRMARQALELMAHIKDRPCLACEFKVNGDCTKWTCVFDAWLNGRRAERC